MAEQSSLPTSDMHAHDTAQSCGQKAWPWQLQRHDSTETDTRQDCEALTVLCASWPSISKRGHSSVSSAWSGRQSSQKAAAHACSDITGEYHMPCLSCPQCAPHLKLNSAKAVVMHGTMGYRISCCSHHSADAHCSVGRARDGQAVQRTWQRYSIPPAALAVRPHLPQ